MSDDRFETSRRSALRGAGGIAIGTVGLTGTSAGAEVESPVPDIEPHAGSDDEDVVLRLSDPDDVTPTGGESVIDLKNQRESEQAGVLEELHDRVDATVKRCCWLANAVLVSIDGDRSVVAEIDGVRDVHPNFHVAEPKPTARQSVIRFADHGSNTYGLDQIGATRTWDTFDVRGDGASVAVLDSGIDADHPDLELADDGWAEFNADGDQVDSNPHDSNGHGTHVSGTVAGGSHTGVAIGVAPEADLFHGKVYEDGATFIQIIAGMEWAVENGVDAVNVSLGAAEYAAAFVEPIRAALDVGTLIVTSSGNNGEGTSVSPANVYDSFAVGATDSGWNVANFSSGEQIHTPTDWGGDAPDDWPEWYTVPDASAPGVSVLSAYPSGSYMELNGTSMAAPHVTGIVALLRSAGDIEPNELVELLTEEAVHPQGGSRDTRWGRGVVNVLRGVTAALHDGVLTGTVTDPNDEQVHGIAVETDHGTLDVTNQNGRYSVPVPEQNTTVSTGTFGYAAAQTVTVEGETTADLQLAAVLDVEITDGQPPDIASGDGFTIEVTAAHLAEYVVELDATTEGITSEDVDVSVDGDPVDLGEPIAFGTAANVEFTVSVDVAEEVSDGSVLGLTHTFNGLDDSVVETTGPTDVLVDPDPASIEIIDPGFDTEIGGDRTLTTAPTIENTGELTGTRTVSLTIDFAGAENVFEESVTLAPGAEETVPFTISFGDGFGAGTGEQTIDTGDDTASGTFEYLVADLQLADVQAPSEVSSGHQFDVDATIENVGDISGEATIELVFADRLVDSTRVGVDPGTEDVVTLSVGTGNMIPATYEYVVRIAGQSAQIAGTVEVTEPAGVAVYADDEGIVRVSGVLAAISDYRSGDLGIGTLLEVIQAYRTGEPVA